LQAVLTTAALNIVRVVACLEAIPRATTQQSPLIKLGSFDEPSATLGEYSV
jgi:hypothetical protein